MQVIRAQDFCAISVEKGLPLPGLRTCSLAAYILQHNFRSADRYFDLPLCHAARLFSTVVAGRPGARIAALRLTPATTAFCEPFLARQKFSPPVMPEINM